MTDDDKDKKETDMDIDNDICCDCGCHYEDDSDPCECDCVEDCDGDDCDDCDDSNCFEHSNYNPLIAMKISMDNLAESLDDILNTEVLHGKFLKKQVREITLAKGELKKMELAFGLFMDSIETEITETNYKGVRGELAKELANGKILFQKGNGKAGTFVFVPSEEGKVPVVGSFNECLEASVKTVDPS